MRIEYLTDAATKRKVGKTDYACAGLASTRLQRRRVGGAIDPLGFPYASQVLGTFGSVAVMCLDEDCGDHLVARRGIGPQILKTVNVSRLLPDVMVRIDDSNTGLQYLFRILGEPWPVRIGIPVGASYIKCHMRLNWRSFSVAGLPRL